MYFKLTSFLEYIKFASQDTGPRKTRIRNTERSRIVSMDQLASDYQCCAIGMTVRNVECPAEVLCKRPRDPSKSDRPFWHFVTWVVQRVYTLRSGFLSKPFFLPAPKRCLIPALLVSTEKQLHLANLCNQANHAASSSYHEDHALPPKHIICLLAHAHVIASDISFLRRVLAEYEFTFTLQKGCSLCLLPT